ncbi:hypothetical protein K5D65_15285 [Pseudomonas cichorii]|nr:hypothetical protein [Pseudomonas cichorii]
MDLNTILAEYRIGDYAGILGLVVSIVGFIWTVRAAESSKEAALQAQKEVIKISEDLRRVNAIADISSAIAVMEEIKRLHRESALQVLLERYSNVRKSLVNVREENTWLNGGERRLVQGAITQFGAFETMVEELLHDGDKVIDAPKMNGLVGAQIEAIQKVLAKVRSQINGSGHE